MSSGKWRPQCVNLIGDNYVILARACPQLDQMQWLAECYSIPIQEFPYQEFTNELLLNTI